MTLRERRRALMAAKKDSVLGLVPGSGYGKSTSTVAAVDNNGYIVITKWSAAWANRFQIPLTGSFMINSGDSVRIVLKKVSGTAGNRNSSLLFYPVDWAAWSNVPTEFNRATIIDKTVTASKSGTINSLVMQLHANSMTTAFTMSIEIYINGKVVLK